MKVSADRTVAFRRLPHAARASRLALACALACTAAPAWAQVTTAIVPDTAPALSTATTVQRGPGAANPNIFINGGRYSGPADNPNANLFHSFTRFDLAPGDVAVWFSSDPSRVNVRNIINRVTGGDPSDLHGRFDSSTFPNADFYFINPAGVVFGGSFSVNVPQSFYVSTAGTLRFRDGTQLRAAESNGSTFSSAPPESFGFIGGQSGDIRFEKNDVNPGSSGSLKVGSGKTALFAAPNLTLTDTSIRTVDTRLRLAAVGAASYALSLDALGRLPQLSGTLTLRNASISGTGNLNDLRGANSGIGISAGNIDLIGATSGSTETAIYAGGDFPNGVGVDMDIQADTLRMSGLSRIYMQTGVTDTPYVALLDIRTLLEMRGNPGASPSAQIGGSSLGANTGTSIVRIRGAGATLSMTDAVLDVRLNGVTRSSGSIDVDVGTIVGERAQFLTSSNFPLIGAPGGVLNVRAHSIALVDSTIGAATASSSDAGLVRLTADILDLTRTNVDASSIGGGTGGTIEINAGQARLVESTLIARSVAFGNAGTIRVNAAKLVTERGSFVTDTFTNGQGGTLSITADELQMNAPLIRSATTSQGNAGNIEIRGGAVALSGAQIESGTSGGGRGGTVTLAATRSLSLRNGSLTSATTSIADAGDIYFSAPTIDIDAFAVTSATSGLGRGGNISLSADRATLRQSRWSAGTSNRGAAGSIDLTGTSSLSLDHMVVSTLSDPNAGAAGAISLHAGDAQLSDTSLLAVTLSGSNAGAVTLDATGTLALSRTSIANSSFGDGNAGTISLIGRSVDLVDTDIHAAASARGDSGDIAITARTGSVTMLTSSIETNATGSIARAGTGAAGRAGTIRVSAGDDVSLLSSWLSSTAAGLASRAGSIEITAQDQVRMGISPGLPASQAIISVTTSSQGVADPNGRGGIAIAARDILLSGATQRLDRAATLSGRVRIASETSGSQSAGAVELRATNQLTLERVDLIAQSARGLAGQPSPTGRAGDVLLSGNDLVLRNAIVEGSSASAGAAGSIEVVARHDLTVTDRSVLSTAASGTGAAGSIDIGIGHLGTIDGLSRVDSDVSGNATLPGDIRVHGAGATLRVSDAAGATPAANRSAISSSTGNATAGGRVSIDVDRLELLNGGGIFAVSATGATGRGGNVAVRANTVVMDGAHSGIQATAIGDADAGSIQLTANHILLANGAEISTNSRLRSAGDITIAMPSSGLLELRGRNSSATITTSSGPGTGGRISIGAPLATISDGGSILALGEARGANVQIGSRYLIRSSDAINTLNVDGTLILDAQVQDISQGIEELDLPFVDAFTILIGRCAGTRGDGLVSQLRLRLRGPYPTWQPRLTLNTEPGPQPCR
ncbi:filamentous hemagglutinin N-terminal domain-containing protein [Sphingomonas sp. Sphisp140]|uniref:two-partner secretion domain-containing protein n=1 Tax=unclassified Sphingomonas TaxID=196159 RepID=UPI0039AF9DFA